MHTAAVVTVSDSVARGQRTDRSGPATAAVLQQHGFDVTQQRAVVDEQSEIEQTLIQLSEQVRLIVTTGGTGIAERDITPEATRAVCSKLIDGIPQKMRAEGLGSTEFAILSRGVCGVRGTLADSESSRQSCRRSGLAAVGHRDFAARSRPSRRQDGAPGRRALTFTSHILRKESIGTCHAFSDRSVHEPRRIQPQDCAGHADHGAGGRGRRS